MCRERLFEYDHEEEDKRFWIFREGFATMVGADQDLESPIVDRCTMSNPKLDGKEKESKYTKKDVL